MTYSGFPLRNGSGTLVDRISRTVQTFRQFVDALAGDCKTSEPTLNDGDISPVQLDQQGRVRVNPSRLPITYTTTLSAPGTAPIRAAAGYNLIHGAYTITGIGTNVIVELQGSLDGTNWFAIEGTNVTKTANGTYEFATQMTTLLNVRCNWVSSSGGTPQVIFTLRME